MGMLSVKKSLFRPKCSGYGQLLLSQVFNELCAINLMLVSKSGKNKPLFIVALLATTLVTNSGKCFVLVSGWAVCFG